MDMIDQLSGWPLETIVHRYDNSYHIQLLHKFIKALEINHYEL